MSTDIEHEPWRSSEYGNLELVRAVQKRPCLYNNTLPEYSRKDITGAAWQEIADEFGSTVSSCKKRWMRLRGAYSKDLRKRKAGKKKPHFLAVHMDFLLPFRVKNQQDCINQFLQDNISEVLQKNIADPRLDCNSDVSSDFVDSGTDMEAVLRVNNELEKAVAELENSALNQRTVHPEDDVFIEKANVSFSSYLYNRKQYILSLQPEINEMTESQFRSFKRKILHLIDDVKFGHA